MSRWSISSGIYLVSFALTGGFPVGFPGGFPGGFPVAVVLVKTCAEL